MTMPPHPLAKRPENAAFGAGSVKRQHCLKGCDIRLSKRAIHR